MRSPTTITARSRIRCAADGSPDADHGRRGIVRAMARTTDETLAFYRELRDKFEPGKPFWNTETADAACGGNPWAAPFSTPSATWISSAGSPSRRSGSSPTTPGRKRLRAAGRQDAHAEAELLGRPAVAAADGHDRSRVGRRRSRPVCMSTRIACAARPAASRCSPSTTTALQATSITVPADSERYTLMAPQPDAANIQLNGQDLRLSGNDEMPELQGRPTPSGPLELAPASITFLTIPGAGNGNCR